MKHCHSRRPSRRFASLWVAAGLAFNVAPIHADALSDALQAMPPNSWQKLNANRFEEVWTPAEQRPTTASPGIEHQRVERRSLGHQAQAPADLGR